MSEARSGLVKGLALGAGLMLLLGAAIGGTAYVMRGDPASQPGGDPGDPAGAAPLGPPVRPLKVHYHPILPKFVVNLPGKGREKFLMVEMSVATNDEKVAEIIDEHAPELRNDLLTMLGEQNARSLLGNGGKTALREKASEILDGLVAKHYAPGRVLDVYLTSFVVQ